MDGIFLFGARETHDQPINVGHFNAAVLAEIFKDLGFQACVTYGFRELFPGPSKVVTSSIFMPRLSCAVEDPAGVLLEVAAGAALLCAGDVDEGTTAPENST